MNVKGWRHWPEPKPLLEDHRVALRVALLLWALGGVLFVALAVPGLRSVVQAVDDGVYRLAVDLEYAPVVRLAQALDFLGSIWVTLPVIVGVGVCLAWRRRWEGLLYWGFAMVISQAMIGPMKTVYARPRPLFHLSGQRATRFHRVTQWPEQPSRSLWSCCSFPWASADGILR